MASIRILLCAGLVAALACACESKRIELVAETDDLAADFGRTALVNAIVELSEQPQDAQAFAKFANRVGELHPLFNRDVARQAELRLSMLAVAPLRAGLDQSPEEQMQRFATTVWPSVLRFPSLPGESVEDYVLRLCSDPLALTCNNVVPEVWPLILNARVWRTLKSQVDVAYDRCQWCADDPSFASIIDNTQSAHQRMELSAQEALERGQPAAWAKAGRHAAPLSTDYVVDFGNDGLVRIADQDVPGGNWRKAIADARAHEDLLGLHLRPERMVRDLLEILVDAKRAGYPRVALVVRENRFPYQAQEYQLDASTRNFRHLGVQDSDSVQVLVQSLDFVAAKSLPPPVSDQRVPAGRGAGGAHTKGASAKAP